MAILLDMTRAHVPVLAGELIDLTARARRDRGRLHLRRRRSRAPGRGPARPDRDARLHRPRPGRRGALRRARRRGRLRDALPAHGLRRRARGCSREEGVEADLVYLDLGISSMQVDARERGFSYSYDAPLDMRMDPSQELDAREIVNGWDERRLAQLFRRYGEEPLRAPDRARDRPAARARPDRDDRRAGGGRSRPRCPPPCGAASAAGIRPSACSRRSGSPSTTSSTRSTARSRWRGTLLRAGGRLAAISFHSLEDRRVKRFLADRARGCICPPDFPVCVCGREPEAELLTRRAVAPTPGEIAENPRAQVGPAARRAQARREAA